MRTKSTHTKKLGRPSKYNEVAPKLLELFESQTRTQSCLLAGVHYSTFLDWMEKYPDFSASVKKAEVVFERKRYDRATVSVQNAMEKQWQAGAWWLERKYGKEFGRREDVAFTVEEPTEEDVQRAILVYIEHLVRDAQNKS